jgi:hypothetical protein
VTHRRSAGAVVAVALLAVVLQWATPAGAQGPGTTLSLKGQTPFVAASDTSFALDLAVTPAPSGPVFIRIDRYDDIWRDANPRAQLDAWLTTNRQTSSPVFDSTAPVPLTDARLQVPISRDKDKAAKPANGLQITDYGVFPLVVHLETADRRPLDDLRTFLILLPEQGTPMRVAGIVGLRAPVALAPDGIRRLDDNDRARLEKTQSVLADHAQTPLTIDPQPETIAALDRASPTLSPSTARAAIGNRPILSSTYVDIDITRFVDAGLRDQVERQRQIGRDALVPALGRPEGAYDIGTYVARRPLSPDALAALATTAPGSASQVVVAASGVGPVEQRTAAGADADLQPFDLAHSAGRSRAVLWDERLSGRLTATGDPVIDAQATLADLTILACGRTGRPHCNTLPAVARGIALVVPDDLKAVVAFDHLLDALTESRPWIFKPVELRDLFALQPAAGPREPVVRDYRVDPASESDLREYAARLALVAIRVGAYRSMLDPGKEAETIRADRLTQLLDVAGGTAISGRYLDEVARRVDTALSGIKAPAQQPFFLTSSDGEVHVAIENSLDHPVTVQVQLTSDKPVLVVEGGTTTRSTTLTHLLPAATEAGKSTVTIPVDIQVVTSGTAPLDVKVLSLDGSAILSTTRIEIRSAVVSWVGLVLTLAAGAFLIVWWARHFRDARRARKLVQVSEVDEAVAIVTGEVPAVSGGR